MMIVPYPGEKGCTLFKSLKKNWQRALPTNIQTRIVYTGTKLSSQIKKSRIPHHLKSNMALYVTPFAMLITVMRVT